MKSVVCSRKKKKNILVSSDIETVSAERSFAAGLNFYKIVWTFTVFSILGFVFESVVCYFQYGVFYNWQGLLYGPFSQVYGLGAVILILFYRKLYSKSIVFLFIFCSFAGGLFEYLYSLVEEAAFGCVSWQYYYIPYNIQGRTNIIFSVVWGAMGAVTVKYLYPLFNRVLESIPNKQGIIVTWVVVIFLSFDILISAAVVKRASERHRNVQASNVIQIFLDKHYPDSYIRYVFPRLLFK